MKIGLLRVVNCALVVVAAGTAAADVTIRAVSEKDGTPWSVTYIAASNVRAENLQPEPSFVLWERGKTQITTVMPSRKSYLVLDQAEVAAQMKQVNEQMKQAEAQMASMPPQVREMMKDKMPNMGSGKPLIELKLTKTGQTATKGGRACKLVDLTITGVPMAGNMGQELCVVAPDSLGIPGGDLETLRQMALFTKEMTKDLGQVIGGMPDLMEMGGWPVWTRDKQSGASWVLKSVERGAVDRSLFSVPAGYTLEKMPSLGSPASGPAGGKKKKNKYG